MSDILPNSNKPMFTEKDCEDVIGELWDLKKLVERYAAPDSAPINFNYFLRNERYRTKVLEKLVQVAHEEIASRAKQLQKRQLRGSVHIDDFRKNSNAPAGVLSRDIMETRQFQKQLASALQKLNKQMRVWQIAFVCTAALLLMSLSWQFYPLLVDVGSKRVLVNQSIVEDTTWTADREYLLTAPVFVEGSAKLFIEAGTRIQGDSGSALIITENAQMIAKGTAAKPIVFTSSRAPGQRQRGDWGGVVLLGKAPINQPRGFIEGVDKSDLRGRFGGNNRDHNCGLLEYVRIEFAGFEAFVDNELNGLTLGGCGRDTIVRHVQVHKSLDDGIEVFGGTVNLSHIVISGPGDDAFDWDMGWRGQLQFMVVQMHGDSGDNALEGDNAIGDAQAQPRSAPVFYNLTLIGGNSQQSAHRGMTIRRGSGGIFANIMLMGFSQEAIDLRGAEVQSLIASGELRFSSLLLNDINSGQYFSVEQGESDDDNGFDEATYFLRPATNARFSVELRMPLEAYNVYAPNFTPFSHSPARDNYAPIPQGEFWDESATFIGAIRPGTPINWLAQWTAFPSS